MADDSLDEFVNRRNSEPRLAMHILREVVKDWHGLQAKVAALFDDMGYETAIERKVSLAGREKKRLMLGCGTQESLGRPAL